MSPEEIAEKSAQEMWRADSASKHIGMKLNRVSPGYALMELEVLPHHCNGHNICHGGITFSLADSCFAFACNSYNERHVGQHNVVSYLRPVRNGDTITARAKEIYRGRKSSIYDVVVVNQEEEKCVEMRGFSHRIGGNWF